MPQCKLGQVREHMAAAEQAELDEMVKYSPDLVVGDLKSRGIKVTAAAVLQHREGPCSCCYATQNFETFLTDCENYENDLQEALRGRILNHEPSPCFKRIALGVYDSPQEIQMIVDYKALMFMKGDAFVAERERLEAAYPVSWLRKQLYTGVMEARALVAVER